MSYQAVKKAQKNPKCIRLSEGNQSGNGYVRYDSNVERRNSADRRTVGGCGGQEVGT